MIPNSSTDNAKHSRGGTLLAPRSLSIMASAALLAFCGLPLLATAAPAGSPLTFLVFAALVAAFDQIVI